MCDAYIYVPQSLTMMHVCMMHISMILDLDPEACVYGACVYDAANFVPNGRTDEQGVSRSRICNNKSLFVVVTSSIKIEPLSQKHGPPREASHIWLGMQYAR